MSLKRPATSHLPQVNQTGLVFVGRAAASALAPAGRSAARFSEPKASVVRSLVAGVRSLGGSAVAELGWLRRGAEGKAALVQTLEERHYKRFVKKWP